MKKKIVGVGHETRWWWGRAEAATINLETEFGVTQKFQPGTLRWQGRQGLLSFNFLNYGSFF